MQPTPPQTLVLLYNLAFTSLPVIVMGAFDQDIDAKVSLAYPQLYKRGIKGLEYSRTVFWTYMLDGLYQSAVCFFLPFIVYQFGITATGQGYGMDGQVEFGTTVAAAAVITVTLFVGLNNSYHTSLMIAVLVISALLLYVSVLWCVRSRIQLIIARSPNRRSGSPSTRPFRTALTTS
jgi:phospholipid-translocating ATPase